MQLTITKIDRTNDNITITLSNGFEVTITKEQLTEFNIALTTSFLN